jgi:hypothetical protein
MERWLLMGSVRRRREPEPDDPEGMPARARGGAEAQKCTVTARRFQREPPTPGEEADSGAPAGAEAPSRAR